MYVHELTYLWLTVVFPQSTQQQMSEVPSLFLLPTRPVLVRHRPAPGASDYEKCSLENMFSI